MKRRLFYILSLMALLVALLIQCIDFKKATPATEKTIAGAATCRQCHAQISDAYLQNPHQQTSHAVTGTKLINNSPLPSSVYAFNAHLKVKVEQRNGFAYQVAYHDGVETIARRFDISFGSGEKAVTYGTWEGNQLKQLPLSYFRKVKSWVNSPGFPQNTAHFGRTIDLHCLECHSSFAARKLVQDGPLKVKEELVKSAVIYGIDCERCHGPAGKHVEFHLEHPQEKAAKYIALYQTLTRKQKTDACATCHGGNDMEILKSIFAFKPGDDLRDYYSNAAGNNAKKTPDVHGNQSEMLAESKCFIQSKTMDCSSCHRTHENLKGNLTSYSQRCISCHATIKHSALTLKNAIVKTNCIDCHMPKQVSGVITFQQAGKTDISAYQLRTHKIGIYH
ncbi:multiheme c-type cytochrome [Pedobacter sp. UYP1]|uniref:multiheme c-type cytochrome n=1 Tax=Pedobacter sp. UYP1 TaxID=1756396 RepID=UPI00339A5726